MDTRGFWVYDPLKDKGIDCTVVHPGDVLIQDKERRKKRDGFVGLIPKTHSSGEKEKSPLEKRRRGARPAQRSHRGGPRKGSGRVDGLGSRRQEDAQNEAIVKIARKRLNRIRSVLRNLTEGGSGCCPAIRWGQKCRNLLCRVEVSKECTWAPLVSK